MKFIGFQVYMFEFMSLQGFRFEVYMFTCLKFIGSKVYMFALSKFTIRKKSVSFDNVGYA